MGNTSQKSYDVQHTDNVDVKTKNGTKNKKRAEPIEEKGSVVEGEVLRSVVDAPLRTNTGVDGQISKEFS